MNFRKMWYRIFGAPEEIPIEKEPIGGEPIEEEIVEPDKKPEKEPTTVVDIPKAEAIRRKKAREGIPALMDAFYGTLIDRDPSDGSLKKKKHAHDGWREGYSHPFEFEGRVYDVQKHRDDSRTQFEELLAKLRAVHEGLGG